MACAPAHTKITLKQPDDWHIHLRDNALASVVVPLTARQFARCTAMPNLTPPVTTVAAAEDYVARLKSYARNIDFQPFVPLYLTEQTTAAEIQRAKKSGAVHALKYYPAGATTNSADGITKVEHLYPILEEAQKVDIPFLMHGEVADEEVDVFDREAVFIDRHLTKLVEDFPNLRMVLEHNTTEEAAQFIAHAPPNICGSITAFHLLYTRDDLLSDGLNPHLYCAPIVKSAADRTALIKAAVGDSGKFFAGTDSAPHLQSKKESGRAPFGVFSANNAMEFYAEIFDENGGLHNENVCQALENFTAKYGAAHYGLPLNEGTITMEKSPTAIPDVLPVGDDALVPLRAGSHTVWTVL